MLGNRIYFGLKPFVPLKLRRAIRRRFALRLRERVRNIWPIVPGSERVPDGWPGWADGKKFALVLTHDVERQGGLDKCRALLRLEQELGFRSSFNFVPEGSYKVPAQLREKLVRNGFEVSVHDLKHGEDFIGLDGSSSKGPRESITISLSGELSDSDQHLCCASWIGCTSWVLGYWI